MSDLPPAVCVIGKRKSGKTVTTVGLVRELSRRGRRVMSAKHGHHFRLDTEGTDSWRHRHEAGAERVVVAGPDELAIMGMWGEVGEEPLESLIARYLHDADVVIAEGFKTSSAAKIEVYRRATHALPVYGSSPEADARYLAILTDVQDFEAHVPVLDVDDPLRFILLADMVEERFFGGG
jgi:molybdopterin-guanine dinucleotide biosynthesis protein B